MTCQGNKSHRVYGSGNKLLDMSCSNKLIGVNLRAKKVVSDSPGLVDFAIGLVNSVFNLPDGQVMFYEEFE